MVKLALEVIFDSAHLLEEELDLLRFSLELLLLLRRLRLLVEVVGLRRLGVDPRARPGTVREGAKMKSLKYKRI